MKTKTEVFLFESCLFTFLNIWALIGCAFLNTLARSSLSCAWPLWCLVKKNITGVWLANNISAYTQRTNQITISILARPKSWECKQNIYKNLNKTLNRRHGRQLANANWRKWTDNMTPCSRLIAFGKLCFHEKIWTRHFDANHFLLLECVEIYAVHSPNLRIFTGKKANHLWLVSI